MNEKIIVKLTQREVLLATQVAAMRHVRHGVIGDDRRWGGDNTRLDWNNEIIGALGECVLARHLGIYWLAAVEPGIVDVGSYQVRASERRNGRLILHPEDNDDHPFVLVRALDVFRYEIAGWIIACDGKIKEFWLDPGTGRPAFFVPVEALKPM